MFTDEPSPFGPSAQSNWAVATLVVSVFALLGLYTYFSRFADPRDARTEVPGTSTRQIVNSIPEANLERSPSGSTVAQKELTIPTAPNPEAAAPPVTSHALSAPTRTTIYLCKAYSGGSFWSDKTCGTQRATIDRMTSVPASLPFEQQVAIARGEAQEAAKLYEQPHSTRAAAIESAPRDFRRSSICDLYDQQVRDLDAEARRPLHAIRQDQIRTDRMNVMSARARERC